MNSISNTNEDHCMGCGACFQICPQKCIYMEENERGFLVPVVDETNCIQCGVCLSVCAEREVPDLYPVVSTYAVVAKDSKLVNKSTSGGAFGVFANHVINFGGIVFGCAWGEALSVEHTMINSLDALHSIQQSKYIQSNTRSTYVQTRTALNSGVKVLYSGTACQIAGLRKFLKKEYDNLITIEVACHGVPSPGLFRKYIHWLGKQNHSTVIKYQFRNKEKHKTGEHYKLRVDFADGRKKYLLTAGDPYYGSFLEGRILRKTCYNCLYKEDERISDITLSDFWGIEKEDKKFPAQHGVSAVMLNSNKAVELFNSIKDQFTFVSSSFEGIVRHNKSIVNSSVCKEKDRLQSIMGNEDDLFFNLQPKVGFKTKVKNLVPWRVKYKLKRLR